jgi:hypothetical protein
MMPLPLRPNVTGERRVLAPSSTQGLDLDLRPHLVFYEPHVLVCVEHIWLLLSWTDANVELWIFGGRHVEQDKADPKHLAQGIEARDFVLGRIFRDNEIGLVAKEAVRARLTKRSDKLRDISFDLSRDNLCRGLQDITFF